MKKFVEYEKLSKKQKREIDKAGRATWGDVSPVTKRIESAKHYNRKKRQRWEMDSGAGVLLCPSFCRASDPDAEQQDFQRFAGDASGRMPVHKENCPKTR